MDQGFVSQEEEAREDEYGAQFGDPRRCPIHPGVRTSSSDGMFDGLCGECESESEDEDLSNPYRKYCGPVVAVAWTAYPRKYYEDYCERRQFDDISF